MRTFAQASWGLLPLVAALIVSLSMLATQAIGGQLSGSLALVAVFTSGAAGGLTLTAFQTVAARPSGRRGRGP